jgi:hypothetical protein
MKRDKTRKPRKTRKTGKARQKMTTMVNPATQRLQLRLVLESLGRRR